LRVSHHLVVSCFRSYASPTIILRRRQKYAQPLTIFSSVFLARPESYNCGPKGRLNKTNRKKRI
jgi:hypothetical protein